MTRYPDCVVSRQLVTVDCYVPFARRFLAQRFGDGPLCLRDLGESDVTAFVLRWVQFQSRGRAKLLVTALRSFFGFSLEHGEIEVDLVAAVPSVANWRLSTVPKYLSQEEVERILGTCDWSKALGRRTYAILLLLARLGLRACEVARLELDDIDWRAGGPKLSAYLGHVHVNDTYWYIEAVPELLQLATERLVGKHEDLEP